MRCASTTSSTDFFARHRSPFGFTAPVARLQPDGSLDSLTPPVTVVPRIEVAKRTHLAVVESLALDRQVPGEREQPLRNTGLC